LSKAFGLPATFAAIQGRPPRISTETPLCVLSPLEHRHGWADMDFDFTNTRAGFVEFVFRNTGGQPRQQILYAQESFSPDNVADLINEFFFGPLFARPGKRLFPGLPLVGSLSRICAQKNPSSFRTKARASSRPKRMFPSAASEKRS
jgi:hypothetical protein